MFAAQMMKTVALLAGGIVMALVLIWDFGANKFTYDHTPDVPDRAVIELRHKAEAKGMRCAPKATLTNYIIFTTLEGKTRVVTFDQALSFSKAGKGTVVLYCS